MTCREASSPRISSSALTWSGMLISGRPTPSPSSGESPRSRVNWLATGVVVVPVRTCWAPGRPAAQAGASDDRPRAPRPPVPRPRAPRDRPALARDHRSSSATCSSRSRRVSRPRLPSPGPARSAPVPCTASKAPTRTSRSTTGRLTCARCQKSASESKGAPATTRATSPSLMPLTSASESRIAHGDPSGRSGSSGARPGTGARSTRYSPVLALTSTPRTVMPSDRASSRSSRLGYMPGSWVSTPARKAAGWCALSQADW